VARADDADRGTLGRATTESTEERRTSDPFVLDVFAGVAAFVIAIALLRHRVPDDDPLGQRPAKDDSDRETVASDDGDALHIRDAEDAQIVDRPFDSESRLSLFAGSFAGSDWISLIHFPTHIAKSIWLSVITKKNRSLEPIR
jgi:hypothetical protein